MNSRLADVAVGPGGQVAARTDVESIRFPAIVRTMVVDIQTRIRELA